MEQRVAREIVKELRMPEAPHRFLPGARSHTSCVGQSEKTRQNTGNTPARKTMLRYARQSRETKRVADQTPVHEEVDAVAVRPLHIGREVNPVTRRGATVRPIRTGSVIACASDLRSWGSLQVI